jgi:uncharacterized alpha-E superfamily protein
MARYTERAENTARMMDVTFQTSLLPQSEHSAEQGWRAVLGISELQATYDQKYDAVQSNDVIDFMIRDPNNPSSIVACLTAARENARAVRGALTTEAWETQNTTWIEMKQLLEKATWKQDPGAFFEWVKYRSHLSRGVAIGTMLRDEAFSFIRLGTFLERADNTARMLDIKYHGLQGQLDDGAQSQQPMQSQAQSQNGQSQSQTQSQPHAQAEESQFDYYYWAAILRSVSAFEIYRKVYRDVITPERVAELLVLRADMPRSLHACMNAVVNNLHDVANKSSEDTERLAGKMLAELKFALIDEILADGLHEYLTRFFEQIFELGNRISRDFLVPLADSNT